MASGNKLTFGVVGLEGTGRRALAAMRHCDEVEVVAVADRDADLVAEAAADAPGFTDHRSLLAEIRPQAVYVALPPPAAAELIADCAQRGIHVIKAPPLARTLAEAIPLVEQMDASHLTFTVATHRRFMRSYRRAIEQIARLGPIFLAQAQYVFNWGPVVGWRADAVISGGGALLELGYDFVDLLTAMLGIPESVFGLNAMSARPNLVDRNGRPMPPCTTDDTAAAVLRFADGPMASLVTSRVSGPMDEQLSLHGQDGSLTANPQHCIRRDPDGGLQDQVDDLDDATACLRDMITAFARAIADETIAAPCSARENLLNMAVMDALYLSEKTAAAESPTALLRAAGLRLEDLAPPV
ncbi:MAG: Gfo/Idh/MocA family protein [Planctomycetota bacterium]|jgi:predicted dehydrogenase